MLGSKTKRVATYGKRAHRIVATDAFSKSGRSGSTALSPPVAVIALDDSMSETSPLSSPVKLKAVSPVIKKKSTTKRRVTSKSTDVPASVRRPLAPREPAVSINVGSKQVARPPKNLPKKPPRSPVVNVEIIILDDEGRTVTKERRVSKTGAQVNPMTTSPSPSLSKRDKEGADVQKPRKAHRVKPVAIGTSSDSETELFVPRRKRAVARPRRIVVSSDEDKSEEQEVPQIPVPIPVPVPSRSPLLHRSPSPPPRTSTSPRKYSTPARIKQRRSSPRPLQHESIANKPRQLTPIRRRKKSFPQSPGSVISPEDDESDLDDTDVSDLLKFADLSMSDYQEHTPEVPEYLLPLLQECHQDSPHEFSSFINSFPFDPLVQTYESKLVPYSKAEFRKVGEASYSEVFGIGSVVLKIVPLRDESGRKANRPDIESPPPSDVRDVLQEIAATRSMGDLCEGFTKLLRTYVVRGKYPSLLLSLWDEFNDVKGSESVKPGEPRHPERVPRFAHLIPPKTRSRWLRPTLSSSCQMAVQTWKRTRFRPLQKMGGSKPAAFFGKLCTAFPMQRNLFHSRSVLSPASVASICTQIHLSIAISTGVRYSYRTSHCQAFQSGAQPPLPWMIIAPE